MGSLSLRGNSLEDWKLSVKVGDLVKHIETRLEILPLGIVLDASPSKSGVLVAHLDGELIIWNHTTLEVISESR